MMMESTQKYYLLPAVEVAKLWRSDHKVIVQKPELRDTSSAVAPFQQTDPEPSTAAAPHSGTPLVLGN